MCQLEIWVRFSPQLPFSCTSIISDRNIWRLPAAQFHFWIIFGYELNTVYCSNLINQKSIAVQAVCKQDVNKILGTSSTLASKLHQIFYTIFSDENGYENIWKIFALGRAVGRNLLFSSFFLSTISMVSTQNFGILRPALHVFCK